MGGVCFPRQARRSGEALFWDGTGVCLFAKRLEDGRFQWPKIENGVMRLSAAQLSGLIEGLDWRRVRAAKDTPAPRLPG
jgi:transposase